jgi:CDP-diacylglycerol--glycerol-3-phosphate 3-phosphatidyltransferase
LRITANQLTVSRILLMPIPVTLVLCENRGLQLLAWALYVLIGITDYFDGMLARRYGFTRFGRLSDPIADKIYVALMFMPLALLDFMPDWIVIVILLRDPLITALRSMSERHGMTMQTATLAKYKTAIQMISGGYVMWVGILPERGITLISMSVMAIGAWFFHVLKWRLRGRWDPRLLTMGLMMTFAVVVRLLLDVQLTLWTYSAVILVVTWVSAWKYIADFARGIRRSKKKMARIWWLLHGLESLAVPLLVLVMFLDRHVPAWLPMAILSTELAVGALDNALTQEGHSRTVRHMLVKLGLQALIAAIYVVASCRPETWPVPENQLSLALAAALGAVTLVTSSVAFARYAPRIL